MPSSTQIAKVASNAALNATLNMRTQRALRDETSLALESCAPLLSGFEHSEPGRFVAPLSRVRSNDERGDLVPLLVDDHAASNHPSSTVRSSADDRPKATRDQGVGSSLRSR